MTRNAPVRTVSKTKQTKFCKQVSRSRCSSGSVYTDSFDPDCNRTLAQGLECWMSKCAIHSRVPILLTTRAALHRCSACGGEVTPRTSLRIFQTLGLSLKENEHSCAGSRFTFSCAGSRFTLHVHDCLVFLSLGVTVKCHPFFLCHLSDLLF